MMLLSRDYIPPRLWSLIFCCLCASLYTGCGSDAESANPNGENSDQTGSVSDKLNVGHRVICIRDNQKLEFGSTVDADPKPFAATVAAACSSKKKEIEETDPVAASAYERERIVQRRKIELGIQVEGSTTVGRLNDVVRELRLTGFDRFVLVVGENRVPAQGMIKAFASDFVLIKLDLIVERDGSPCGAKITLGENKISVETSGIDFIMESLERQIEKLEPPIDASRRELEIELIPAPEMSAVHYFKFCDALQSLIDNRKPTTRLDIKQYPLGYPREASLGVKEMIDGLSIEKSPDLLPNTKPQKKLSEFDLDEIPE